MAGLAGDRVAWLEARRAQQGAGSRLMLLVLTLWRSMEMRSGNSSLIGLGGEDLKKYVADKTDRQDRQDR